ncbi:MAG: aminotransferase class I/II-fold pyridoxal phosphate-dependent enzyme, partial [Sphingomonadaceae bacterium]
MTRLASGSGLFAAQKTDLSRLADMGRLRALASREGRDFASNDYLALAGCRRLSGAIEAALKRGVPVGSGGSRLLRGNHETHEQLEEQAARFFGAEAALYFSTGYAANSALISTL